MRQGRTFAELADEVTRQANSKRDLVARSRIVEMLDDGRMALPGHDPMPMQDVPHGQVAEFLDIPRPYYGRLREQVPALLAVNVNTLMQRRPTGEKRLVRTLDGNVRAWLSNTYRPIDNVDLMEQLLPTLMGRTDVRFASAEITERRLYLKVLSHELEGEVKRGDVVRMGLLISNSEVGMGSITVAPFTERLICTNGAVHMNLGQRKNHIGRALGNGDSGDVEALLSDEARKADDRAFFLKVRDVVQATLAGDTLTMLLEKMREAAEDKLEGDPADLVENVTTRLGMNEGERGTVLRNLIEGADLSRWGLANAITRTAQESESYDRATELEAIGGDLMVASIAREMATPVRVRRRTATAA